MAPRRPRVKDPAEDLVDRNIKIWWPKDRVFYEGTVTSFDHSNKKHTVLYTDGETEILNLKKERWEFADEEEADANAEEPAARQNEHQATHAQTDSCNQNSPEISSTSRITNAFSELVDVNGCLVKASTAPSLKTIFEKHGDIAANCPYESAYVRGAFMEAVCDIVQRLEKSDIAADMDVIVAEFADVVAAKIDVSWLRSHFPSEFGEELFQLRDTKAKALHSEAEAQKDFAQRLEEMMEAQDKLKEAEKLVKLSESEAQKFDGHIKEYMSKWKQHLESNTEGGSSEEAKEDIRLASKKRGAADKKTTINTRPKRMKSKKF